MTPSQLHNKQMRSTGVLTERETATEVLQEPLATRSLQIYLDTDDSVSAQIKAWQLHCGECEDNLHVWSCRSPCWKHQYHLDRKDAYVHADWLQHRLFHSVGGFFATLAKWMKLWRCFFAKISWSWGFARDQDKTRMRLPPLAEEAKRRGVREPQRNALQEGGGQPKLAWIPFPTTTRISSLCLMLLLKLLARA